MSARQLVAADIGLSRGTVSAMTVPPRGATSRRSGRRPGWPLLTALLVLAILASSTLVFTSRVELLRLAVILSLWAAVLTAFVSVTYRRQSQLDSAKARDMKYVYDLQLDREISARREYELSVEAHLRRQLAAELRSQATDEMAALRAELATLRVNLQALLGADLGERPALGSEIPMPEPLAMPMPPPPDRVKSSRIEVTQVEITQVIEDVASAVESPILDVPEEPLTPPVPPTPIVAPEPAPRVQPPSQPAAYRPPTPPGYQPSPPADGYRGSHRRGASDGGWVPPAPPSVQPVTAWRPPETRTRPGRHRSFEDEPVQPPQTPWLASPAGRHRGADEAVPVPEEPAGQHSGGAPVADLMARLRDHEAAGGSGKGGRRHKKD